MKTHVLFTVLIAVICIINSAVAAPNNYTDFLPKYRSQNDKFALIKIEYMSDKMVIHFQYVVDREGMRVKLSGASTANAWKLFTSSRGGTGLTEYATIKNVKVSGALKAAKVEDNNEAEFSAKFGEIIAGEAHFSKLPTTIRSINFSAGAITICNDLLIKEKNSPMLGTEEQMDANVNRFYRMLSSFSGIDVVKPVEKVPVAETKPAPTVVKTTPKPATTESAPLKYTPKELVSMEDMECETRVVLRKVYFNDNSAEYAGRVEALKTISIVRDYLNYYTKAQIKLHGHTDIFGNPINNIELSKKRVLAVKSTLIKMGIKPERIHTFYHGSRQPLPELSRGGKKNRRVEVEVVCG